MTLLSFRNKRLLLFCIQWILVSYLLCRPYPALAENNSALNIHFNNGKLSVNLKNTPMEAVLKEIMTQSGAKIWVNDSIDTTVTIEYKNIPLREGVRRILKDKNYAFLYAPHETREGKLSIVNANNTKEIFTKVKIKPRKKSFKKERKRKKKRNDTLSIDSLMKIALESEDADEREEAIDALGETGDKKVIKTLAKALAHDQNEDVKLSAIDALLEIDDSEIITVLSQALKDKNPLVREYTIEALEELEDATTIELIKSMLNDENDSVRETAEEVLEYLEEILDE